MEGTKGKHPATPGECWEDGKETIISDEKPTSDLGSSASSAPEQAPWPLWALASGMQKGGNKNPNPTKEL